ncbi:DUF2332 domain-containing protein [Mobilicoccus pelagius]|uniref:DUF2332 domain-containing protein n=1 Tax=Mobilicoccus pelagius NBRC 104925 TaxID=1089455 RepID=H5UR76_9MICO|nr:DUF2332 domain-containing protein [Mobilicoccus pelagius]GAB48234.1 hypothetical protein MOPEL_067_00840 [Mobilicoccus pelagius NBRC 104925]
MKLFDDVVAQYEDFAAHARRDSPCFTAWATRVAGDDEVLAWVGRLPPIKQQPNIVFAAARWHGVPAPGPYEALRETLLADDPEDPQGITATILARSTQTNEVGRLATLSTVFARIVAESGRPLALVEAGASAGACLYPDRYAYRYLVGPEKTPVTWRPAGAADSPATELTCRAKGSFVPPTSGVPVAWRGGLDLAPVDAADDDATSWLETLVWPEQEARRERLRTALDVVREDPPVLRRGDILTSDLDDLIDEAAEHGEVVVFHTAVVAYLEPDDRERFVDAMTDRVAHDRCRWVSNEGKNVVPSITATGPTIPEDHPTFVLGLDGTALAWTHGHGRSLTWLDRAAHPAG